MRAGGATKMVHPLELDDSGGSEVQSAVIVLHVLMFNDTVPQRR